MQGRDIKKALHAGEIVYGTHLTYLSNFTAINIILSAGLDYAFLCGEHMPLDSNDIANVCQYLRAAGVSPIVRISSPDPVEATRALDLGAQGIVVPYVEKVEDVKALVGAVHYRPLKGEQLRALLRGEPCHAPLRSFFDRFNADNYLIIGIESCHAYEHLDELISVPGVDGVFLGPHDLTVSAGHPEDWTHPAYMELTRDTIRRCRARGLGVGLHLPTRLLHLIDDRELQALGMNWILDGADATWAAQSLSERRKRFLPYAIRSHSIGSTVNTCATIPAK